MEQNGQAPGNGPVVVTGGPAAWQPRGRHARAAVRVVGCPASPADDTCAPSARRSCAAGDRPGQRPWRSALAGAIDNLGAPARLLTRTVDQWGNIASVVSRRARSSGRPVCRSSSRVNLLGINSVHTPRTCGSRCGRASPVTCTRAPRPHLQQGSGPRRAAGAVRDYLKGQVTGRTVVKIA